MTRLQSFMEWVSWHVDGCEDAPGPLIFMPLTLLLVVATMLMSSVFGCTDSALQVQAQVANGVAQAANAGLPLLVDRYRNQGFSEMEAVKGRGGTEEEARAAIARVEAEWDPVWKAWDTLQLAQNKWATVIETGGNTLVALAQLKDAYCKLRLVWPKGLPAIPLAPLRCEP